MIDEMRKRKIKPNSTTFTNAISGFYREQKLEDVDKVLVLMKEYGLNPGSNSVYNVRIEGLCKLKRTREAKDLYREMLLKGMKPNWVTYNHLIVGFCKEGMLEEAKRVYEEMGKKRVVPGEGGCYFSLIHYLCQGGDFEAALGVFKDAMRKNWMPGFKTMKMLVNGLVKIGKVEEGKEIVEKIKEKFPTKAEMWKEVEESFPKQ
ncbi:uncharacterized protein A4U43_C10F16530 [Asparagus officinalis]|uniref:Pentacotripeptide-repeat region of PRORP domain-containing protein n=1 Tax=Asparagus officinalis TaxID=4686 RepID=A0A5P1E366_ASPOF|nr:pentatricopeptide repeat-containing protein At1g61870, mitochondrial-like [Asparagus officinalis]ONK57092.1 uncharacterized protein A4U43_C10F16530 [Asparagus officinalis]